MFSYQEQQQLPPPAPPRKTSNGWGVRKIFGFDSKPEPIPSSNYYAPEVSYIIIKKKT